MKTFKNPVLDFLFLGYRYVTQVIVIRPMNAVRLFSFFFRDWVVYKTKPGAERIRLIDTYPILLEKTAKTSFDPHYFYQSAWASRKIFESKTPAHVDVGSQINLIANLNAFTKVTFIDIRPLEVTFPNIIPKKGSILAMPYPANSIHSLSCLHVAEHIGLGRYGDPLDPKGTRKACAELSRVLAKGGNLYFSGPVGKDRVCFNAHRIHSPKTILNYFSGLRLVSVSAVDDRGRFIAKADLSQMAQWQYGCGMFHFTKD